MKELAKSLSAALLGLFLGLMISGPLAQYVVIPLISSHLKIQEFYEQEYSQIRFGIDESSSLEHQERFSQDKCFVFTNWTPFVLGSFPSCVLDSLRHSHLEIVYTNRLPEAMGGTYVAATNQVLIRENVAVANPTWARRALYHEIGHAYFFIQSKKVPKVLSPWALLIGMLREEFLKKDFRDFTKGEVPPTEYAKTNTREDMAESFALYFTERHSLRQHAPKRYEWIAGKVSCEEGR